MKYAKLLTYTTAAIFLMTAPAVLGCITAVGWVADLSRPGTKYSTSARESGTAQMNFDWIRPYGTIVVQTHNVHNVTSIELRRVTKPGQIDGPVITRLFDSRSGTFTGKLTKKLTVADVPLSEPTPGNPYASLPDAILHKCVVVAVCTKAHPRGELVGMITAHQITIYSPDGTFHDAALHKHAATAGI